jgi:hypothetical protein
MQKRKQGKNRVTRKEKEKKEKNTYENENRVNAKKRGGCK